MRLPDPHLQEPPLRTWLDTAREAMESYAEHGTVPQEAIAQVCGPVHEGVAIVPRHKGEGEA